MLGAACVLRFQSAPHGLSACLHGLSACLHGLSACLHGLSACLHGLSACLHGLSACLVVAVQMPKARDPFVLLVKIDAGV
jgi:hypothetical protein